MTESPRLLIRLGSLGDVVLATAAAAAWKKRLGSAPLDVLVKTEWAGVWAGHPAVRHVLEWPATDLSPLGLLRWIGRLRAGGYGEAVDLQGTTRTRLLTLGAGIPVVGRPRKYTRARRSLVRWKRGGPPEGFRVVESFLGAVGGETVLPAVHPGTADGRRAEECLGDAGPVGLVPGARHATKQWPAERFAALGQSLHQEWAKPVPVFLGPDEDPVYRRLDAVAPGIWAPVRESIPVAAAALARCRVVVTGDTGLMHLAAAVGTRVVALFGPTVLEFGFPPTGPGHRVLERAGLPCRPCSVHGGQSCPLEHFRCLLEITEPEVFQAVTAALEA